MNNNRFDLIVIGSGPGGEKGAAQAAYFGKKVLLIEKEQRLGGACIHTGTIPSKTLLETALSAPTNLSIEGLMTRKDRVVDALSSQVRTNMEVIHQVQIVRGTGSLTGGKVVRVRLDNGETEEYKAEVILLATGSRPYRPMEVPFDSDRVFDSDTVLEMAFLPQRIIVVGGGVVACEYACIFAALGVEVTVVEERERLVSFADEELSSVLEERFVTSKGIQVRTNTHITLYDHDEDEVRIQLADGLTLHADALLFAAGRIGNVEQLGLETENLNADSRGRIGVNEKYRTSADGIYAVGDLVGFPSLASVSMEQGRIAVCDAFGFGYKQKLAHELPLCIYTIPELAGVGKTEQDCQKENIPYLVGRTKFGTNARGQIGGDTEGFLKLIFHADDKKLLGAHILGEAAAENIHLAAAVLHYGDTIDYFIDAVFNYPTLSDAYKYAAYDGLGAFSKHHKRLRNPQAVGATIVT
jgi:NAD(P) transhydrogenase